MKKLSLLFLAIFAAAVVTLPAFVGSASAAEGVLQQNAQCKAAAGCIPATPDPALQECTADKPCDLVNKYLNPMINALAVFVGVAVVIGIILGGIQYASSGGDPQKSSAGKTHIRNAIIALVLFFFLFAFLQFLIPGTGLLGV